MKITTMLLSVLTLCFAANPLLAENKMTEAMKKDMKSFTYKVGSETFEGQMLVSPTRELDKPTIFIMHDWDGLTEYEQKRMQMLYGLGYTAVAIDLFGKGKRPTTTEDKKKHTGELYQDRKKMRAIMLEGMRKASEMGASTNNAIAMGYCFGGAAVLELARSGTKMKGFATFHGGLGLPEGQSYKEFKGGKIMVFHGSADKMITMESLAELGQQLESAGIDHELISYGGADHAFTVFESERYNKNADHKSWKRFLAFADEAFNMGNMN